MSKLDKAGFTLTSTKQLLKLADDLDALGILEASSNKVLPLLETAIDLSPKLLPLAAPLLNTSPVTLSAAAVASLALAGGVIFVIPDDSVANIALQTAAATLLGAIVPGACAVGSVILGKINK